MSYFNQESINTHYPESLMIPAMNINKIPDGKEYMLQTICENHEYFAQLKKDGYFYEFEKTANYSYLFSRNTSAGTGLLTEKGANVPHIMDALKDLPPRTILIGEIYYPGKTSKDVTKVMGCLAQEALTRQKNTYGLIHYYIHDIIYYDGYDLLNVGAELRYKILEKIFVKHGFDKYDFLELATIETEDIFDKIAEALASGEEGMVLKKKDSLYTPGKRPAWATIKIKQIDYADVIVTGFCDATKEYTGKELESWGFNVIRDTGMRMQGNYSDLREMGYDVIPVTKPWYYGWKTAVEISAYDSNGQLVKIGTVSSGLTDEMRQAFAQNPNMYLGKVCAVECMMKDSKEHTIRHGRFKQWRDDKDAAECTLENIF